MEELCQTLFPSAAAIKLLGCVVNGAVQRLPAGGSTLPSKGAPTNGAEPGLPTPRSQRNADKGRGVGETRKRSPKAIRGTPMPFTPGRVESSLFTSPSARFWLQTQTVSSEQQRLSGVPSAHLYVA